MEFTRTYKCGALVQSLSGLTFESQKERGVECGVERVQAPALFWKKQYSSLTGVWRNLREGTFGS